MATTNRYLQGNYAPVRDERTETRLQVTGTLPDALNGTLLRNGPNPVVVEDPATYHWFTGAGMVHGIELRDGRAASYRNRWVRSAEVSRQLGEEPVENGVPSVFPIGDGVSGNTHVVSHAGRIFALVEVELPTELSPTLETLGRYDFGGKLRSSFTAHPHVDPATGDMHFVGYDIFGPPWLRYHVVDATGTLVRSEDISIKGPSMIHDFCITESRVVFFDLPVVFDIELVDKGGFPFRWTPEYGARVGVMPRSGGDTDVVWVETENCYVYHPLNAHDDGERVVVDVCRYDTMFVRDVNGPFGDSRPTLWRWTIDPVAGMVKQQQLDDRACEFPRVPDVITGRPHRFGYSVSIEDGDLLKYDLERGTTEAHPTGPGRVAGEGVFVPAPDSSNEDAGWLLSVVYDPDRAASDVIVVNAQDFDRAPVATVHLPVRVPFGFHGSWVPDRALA